ncbi:MAG: ribbon-helix-helix protein, CopG family [Desulfurococcaceae archaeon]
MSEFKNEIEKIKNIVEESFKKAINELEDIKKELSEWPYARRLSRLYNRLENIVDAFDETLDEARKSIQDIKRKASDLGDKVVLDAVDNLEKLIHLKIKEFNDKYNELLDYIENNYPGVRARHRSRWVEITMLPWRLTRTISEEVSDAIKQALSETRKALEYASTVVSSIRLRDEDMKLIDELVEAGIFKSRSEAVAFFTRKGIEASRDWLEKVKENLAKIKELREQILKELSKREDQRE